MPNNSPEFSFGFLGTMIVDVAKLVLEYIQALVWPAVAVVAVVVFRKSLTALLGRLHEAEMPGGIKLNFEKEVRQAEDLSREVKEAAKEKARGQEPIIPVSEVNARMISLGLRPSPSGLDLTYYRRLAAQDPNIALAGLRMEFEILARNLAKGFKVPVEDRDSASTLFRKLYDHNAISIQQFQLGQSVLRLCNAAVHGTIVTRQDADSVLDAAKVLADDYVAWLSWGFQDGWTPRTEGSQAKAEPDTAPDRGRM
jgi:hypothetical protein